MKTLRFLSWLIGLGVIFSLGCSEKPEQTAVAAEVEAEAPEIAMEPEAAEEPVQSLADTAISDIKDKVPAIASGFTEKMSVEDIAAGLKEALVVSSERAAKSLSNGGISNNPNLSIPLPEPIEKLRKPLESVGQTGLLDNLEKTVEQAAEEAIAVSPEVLRETIESIDLKNVTAIWKGGDDAATQYLKTHAAPMLIEKMSAIVEKTTQDSGAVQAFTQIKDAIPEGTGNLLGQLGAAVGYEIPADFSLNSYVTDKTMGLLFDALAKEEAKLRADPMARSSELLKMLFGG
jgi:hypothetical protein